MNIGIDIDDTISKSIEKTEEYAKEYTETILKRDFKINYKEIDFLKRYNWTIEEDNEFLKEYYKKILQNAELKEDANKVIEILHKTNKIYIITAREDEVKEITLKWLERNNIIYDKIFFKQIDKKDIVKDLEIDVFIDDSFENCVSVAKDGTKTFIVDTKINQGLEDDNISRVYSWNEIYEKINV